MQGLNSINIINFDVVFNFIFLDIHVIVVKVVLVVVGV